MRDRLRDRYHATVRRVRRIERRESYQLGRWLENTRNVVHLSILIFVPLLVALVTVLSNAVGILPYLLFPPLASGTYTLFAQPESEYASPGRFVGGLTTGALCGWLGYELLVATGPTTAGLTVSPFAAAVSVFLTGVVTWLLDIEEASAYSSALLVHVLDVESARNVPVLLAPSVTIDLTPQFAYVISVFISTTLVAAVFVVWHHQFYEHRARYLYESTRSADHVLVPMRTETADRTAMLAARLAAAHNGGKVVLLDIVAEEAVPAGSETDDQTVIGLAGLEQTAAGTGREIESPSTVDDDVARLEERAADIETHVGVPCEVLVGVDTGSTASLVRKTAKQTNCDLIATPYEERYGSLSPFVRSLFRGDVDVLVHRSADERTTWRRVMVPVRSAGDVAHAMIDFALRLAGRTGQISVCHCIGQGQSRRAAQSLLSDLVEPFDGPLETLVSRSPLEEFLADHATEYDLVIMGASMDRSVASRLVSPPMFERIHALDCDVAIVDRRDSS